jgi:hypothetical protein
VLSTTVRIDGAAELRKALKYIGDDGLKKELREANRGAADVVAKQALPKVPVRSGNLRRTVKALATQRDGRVQAGSARVDYAAAIHWGRKVGNVWGGQMARNPIRGRPFLWDAAQRANPKVIEEYEQAIDELLAKLKGGVSG